MAKLLWLSAMTFVIAAQAQTTPSALTQVSAPAKTATAKKAPGVKTAQATTATTSNSGKTSKKGNKSPASAAVTPSPAVTTSLSEAIQPKLHNRSSSEYAFQLGENERAISVSPRYYKSERSYTISNTKLSETYLYNTIDIAYSRAMGPDWVGTVSGYVGNADVTSGTVGYRDSGFSDISLKAQTVENTPDGQMFRGGFVNLSPGDHQMGYDWATATTKKSSNGNLYSGGHSFGGFVGRQFVTPEKIYGYKGTGQYNFVRKANQGTATGDTAYEFGGGHSISGEAFAEFPDKKPVYLGVKAGLSYIMASDVNVKQGATSSNLDSDARQIMSFGAYGRINYSEATTILPAIQINKQLNSASGKWSYEGQDDFSLTVGARFAL